MIGQVWEHWRRGNRLRIIDIDNMVHCIDGRTGGPYTIDPEDLMADYLYIGELVL